MGSICYSSETEFLVIYLMIPCWTFLFVVGWDSFSIPDKKAVFDLFAPFGEMEFLRVEKTYGRFILLRSGESWEAISLEGLFEINQLYLP
jgi:hypothetical protein